jgi:hypothetical protein
MKQFPKLFLAVFLLALTGCIWSEPQSTTAPADVIPEKLDFTIIGVVGPSYHIEWREGFLDYTVTQPGQKPKPTLHLSPSPEQWRDFRHQLDRLKVWQWQPDYGNQTFISGTQWLLEIQYSDRSLHSRGHRDFPKHYDAFLKSVGKLLGSWEIE